MPSSFIEHHVLNFFRDDEGSCALTVLINRVRFHVIADASKIRRGTIGQQYSNLLQALTEEEIDEDEGSATADSGVDVGDTSKEALGAQERLERWMLAPLESTIGEVAPADKGQKEVTLRQWYTTPAYYFDLEAHDKQLCAIELEPDAELRRRVDGLLPEIAVPKYVREVDVPWLDASDLVVLEASDSPAPYHPSRVRTKAGEVFFIKLVDSSQPQPTKREITLLRRIAEKSLHNKIRCPALEGIVTFEGDRTKIMGFLQTDIPLPVPLTTKLDPEIPQDLRDRWAAESERMKNVLHENGIIWGDAKADNFMVDKEDRLWIIDFGGSYTDGWVAPDIKETEEGDDMGVAKIANALHDPVENVWNPDTDKSFGGSSSDQKQRPADRKRKRPESPDDVAASKRRTSRTRQRFCLCDSPSSGRMVACDNVKCEGQWFHFECVGITQPPSDDEPWYCDNCRTK